jgi:putative ABC transport system permease protein
LGIVGALALARLLSSLLYGVGAADPAAYGAAGLILIAIGVLAAWLPARRASRVDPAVVLRES